MSEPVTSLLFACNMNSVRSPMAEALARHYFGTAVKVESCGVYKGYTDPFIGMILSEKDISLDPNAPKDFSEVQVKSFDKVVALTPEAAKSARALGAEVVYWDIANPTDVRGSDEDLMKAYRDCRETLNTLIQSSFDAAE
ncbi:MAG: low molecular weight phosphatase family protein [Pseudomonadota bacterium]